MFFRDARDGNKVLSVHSVRSAKMVLDLIETHFPLSRGRIILHWFSGSPSEARRAAELGCYFSVNFEMLSNDGGRRLVADLRADLILTETDGPFTRFGDRAACPSDVGHTVRAIAALRKVAADEIKLCIAQNLRALVGNKD